MSSSSTRCCSPRRLLLPALAVAGAVAALRVGRRRRPAIDQVATDLRSPVLYLPGSLSSARALRVLRALPAPPTPVPPGVTVGSRTITTDDGRSLRVLVHEAADRPKPSGALLWIHGGGLIMGTPEQGNALTARWAEELGALIVSVDYRLAPEDPFPAALDDCVAALAWLADNAEELGVDPTRIAVGGDSAGGGLAAALCQVTRDRGGPAICFQLLEYPMIDDRTVVRATDPDQIHFIWTAAANRFGWASYLGHDPGAPTVEPYASPARTEDLAGLPPAWIGVGDLDLFHDEDVDYAERLTAAGVPCELHVEPGMYHGADALAMKAPTSRAFRDRMTAALAAAIAPG